MEIERERNDYDYGHSNRKLYDLSEVRKGGSAGFLVWEELTVALSNRGTGGHTKRLIRDVSGYAEPGRIMAIMGPSGSGKSTLLDALAGRLAGNVVQTGNILLNGRKRRLDYGILAYVTQENILLGTLTVRETITYSANLRFPSTMTKEEIMGEVETVIIKMGLQDCADRNIGNWHLRGISGGEKKRLCIAIEILTHPVLLFLDEPTSGLDSASAFFVIQTLRNMTREGKTVVCSIHQPSSEVFALFDDLTLLSGGEAVYFGDAKSATQFFAEAGFPCPNRRNPSDHFLRCVNSDFDRITANLKGSQKIRSFSDVGANSDPLARMATADIKRLLIDTYKSSEYAAKARTRMDEISRISEDLGLERIKGSQANWWKQLYVLTRRSFSNMYRDMGYYRLRIVIYILVSLCVGTIYFNVGTSYTAIFARGSCGAFISGFLAFMSIGGFPSFIEEMKVFYRERLNGHYGVAVFILSNFFSSMPFLLLISFISGTMIFFMVKFHSGVSHYLYSIFNLYGCISVVESLMMIVASLVPNFLMGIITGAGVIGILMMTSGFFRLLPDLPKPVWRYPISYLSYGSWALQGGYKNDLIGIEFDPLIGETPKIRGEDVIRDTFGISLARSKWWDLAAIFVILFSYRVMFFFVLKIKERLSPLFKTLLSNRTLKQLKRRPSWRRKSTSFRLVSHLPLNPENSPTI